MQLRIILCLMSFMEYEYPCRPRPLRSYRCRPLPRRPCPRRPRPRRPCPLNSCHCRPLPRRSCQRKPPQGKPCPLMSCHCRPIPYKPRPRKPPQGRPHPSKEMETSNIHAPGVITPLETRSICWNIFIQFISKLKTIFVIFVPQFQKDFQFGTILKNIYHYHTI